MSRTEQDQQSAPPGEAGDAAHVRIFCLPHAGGSAIHCRHWGQWLPDAADIVPVDLPGHGARTLQNHGLQSLLLVVACRNGPTAALSHRPIHGLPDAQFPAALGRLGDTPQDVISAPGLLRMFLPLLRSDLRLAETYARESGPPLMCPIAVFGGRQDPMADGAGLLAWERETTHCLDLTIFDAGHFFLDQARFSAALGARLTRLPAFA